MSGSTSLWNFRAFALWMARQDREGGEGRERQAGFETVLLETRHVKAALSAMTMKTDRKDGCRLAQLLACP